MQRYFFHLRNGADLLPDPDGRWLDIPDEASRKALQDARSIIAEDARDGRIRLDQRIDIENEARELVHQLEFRHAIEIAWPVER